MWIKIMVELDSRASRFKVNNDNLEARILSFKQNEAVNIDKACTDLLRTKFARYEEVREKFAQFFDSEDLSAQLDNKANLAMVKQINDSRATKTELEEAEMLI